MAREQLSDPVRKFHIKLTTNWLPISAYANRHSNTITTCLKCTEIRSTDHLFLCPGNEEGRKSYIIALESNLQEMNTSPEIVHAILHGLQQWMRLPISYTLPESMKLCTYSFVVT
jgi:hypothetical protein